MDQDTKTSSHRGKGRGRGRGRKKAAEPEKNSEEPITTNHEAKSNEPEPITLDLDADITQLEAPTFSTINKGPPEPMLRLSWDHKTHLIGEKVINPMIHCCDKCEAPILIYGRMIPCKHVFCSTCAERECKTCPRCQEKVVRIERTGLGTVFMCTFGGTRYGNTGCRRTYLSQRDLLAHINHRHVVGTANTKEIISNSQITPSSKAVPTIPTRSKPSGAHHGVVSSDPRIQSGSNHEYFYKMHSPSSHPSSSQPSHRTAQQHHSTSHHHNELHPITTQQTNSSHNVSYTPTTTAQQPSQRHLPTSTTQPLMQPAEFVNQMMVPNYPPPTPTSVTTLPSIRSNLITIQTHDSTMDPGSSPMGVPMTPNFPHQAFSPQFTPISSAGIPFPVPPPGQTGITALSQTPSQFYPSASISYPLTTAAQRPPVTQFSPNSPGQPIMNQSQMIPGAPPQMVPAPRRTQFSRDNVIQQQFPVTPSTHRWHQPNQPQFF